MDTSDLLNLKTTSIDDDKDASSRGARVVAKGEIDVSTSTKLAEALDALINDGMTVVVLDAAGVNFIDSSGLRVIVNSGNRLSAAGGQLLIEGMSGAVQRVLEVSGLIEHYRS